MPRGRPRGRRIAADRGATPPARTFAAGRALVFLVNTFTQKMTRSRPQASERAARHSRASGDASMTGAV
jgi:hypothetical protein